MHSRGSLCNVFKREEDLDVCGEAENGKEAVEKAQELHPDLILLDLASPLNYAAIQSGNIKSPSKKEAGLDVSHHALISREGGRDFFLTSSLIG
jgi:DNA-binding NarL/FixJ family response regulator